MKPKWEDAPSWANWLCQCKDGSWWWYQDEPKADTMFCYWTTQFWCKTQPAFIPLDKENVAAWTHTLEKRNIK